MMAAPASETAVHPQSQAGLLVFVPAESAQSRDLL
jgi:hypothetical protein